MKKVFVFIILYALCPLINAQTPTELWGVAKEGGSGFGTLFKMDKDGKNPFLAYSFDVKASGRILTIKFNEASNHKLYATMAGGKYDEGVIMELDPATGKV